MSITVEDDGLGIEYSESCNLLKKSMSSKTTANSSFGYKGEALYSLSVLAQSLQIISKASDSTGFKLICSQGCTAISQIQVNKTGTVVTVLNPFHLVPVRHSEWKKRRSWYSAKILDYVKLYSILYPVRFRLSYSWKENIEYVSVPKACIIERLKIVLNIKSAVKLETKIDHFNISAYLLSGNAGIKIATLNNRPIVFNLNLTNSTFGYFLVIVNSNDKLTELLPKGSLESKKLFAPPKADIEHWINTQYLAPQVGSPQRSKSNMNSPLVDKVDFKDIRRISDSRSSILEIAIKDLEKIDIVGQFNNGFVVGILENSDTPEKIVIIDQHAADERIFYETYKSFSNRSSQQKLISPIPLNWNFESQDELQKMMQKVSELGFEIIYEATGPELVSVPSALGIEFSEPELRQIITNEFENRSSLDTVYATKACKSAVKICHSLDSNFMKNLVKRMSKIQNPWVQI